MPRLPPSLKWLIDRRGRIAGEIRKVERELLRCRRIIESYKKLNKDLAALKDLLEAVDRTLALHEIQVQLDLIPTIRSQEAIRFPHGLLTKTVYECFRVAGKRIVSTDEIKSFVTMRLYGLGYKDISRADLAKRVKNSLHSLYHRGRLQPHHDQKAQGPGLWSLVEGEFTLDIQSQGAALGSSP